MPPPPSSRVSCGSLGMSDSAPTGIQARATGGIRSTPPRLGLSWGTTTIRQVGSVKLGRQRSPAYLTGNWPMPYLRVANVLDGFIDYSDVLEMDFTETERKIFSLRPGDILLNEGQSLELVGRCAIYDRSEGEYCFQNTLVRFRPNRGQSPSFYRWLFKWFLDRGLFKQIAKQTTSVAHLGADRFAGMRCPNVPLDHQKQIAEILDSLQDAIERTEALIAKTQQIKTGLMHDLFTRGVTPDGRLRPPQDQAPELYKQSPLGWIPQEWGVFNSGDCAANAPSSLTIGPFGSDLVTTDYRNEGVPVVFVRDVKESTFAWNSGVYITPEKALKLDAHQVRPGDVVSTKMGLPPCVSCVYPDWMPPGVITADIVRLRPNLAEIDARWFAAALNTEGTKRQVKAITAGVTRPKITLTDFRRLRLACPGKSEQMAIADRLAIVDGVLHENAEILKKLETQKVGLMRDLLSGIVPVPGDDDWRECGL